MELYRKLTRAIGMLCKIRQFVNLETPCMIYYGSQIWAQHKMIVKNFEYFKRKLCEFLSSRSSAIPLFRKYNILRLCDNIRRQNILYAHDTVEDNLPRSFVNTIHEVKHIFSWIGYEKETILYGTNSIKSKSVDGCNLINMLFYSEKLHEKSKFSCKMFVAKFLISRY